MKRLILVIVTALSTSQATSAQNLQRSPPSASLASQANTALKGNSTGPYPRGVMPATTIKAADYGAICNGAHDDTSAINAAVSGAVSLNGGQIQPANPVPGPATVELPQGTCVIRAPIVMHTYGSLTGSANGTYLDAADAFTCNAYGCDMVQMDVPYRSKVDLLQTVHRFVKDINFQYFGRASAITGIHVFNQTGNIAATPYPQGFYALPYQLLGVEISGNTFFAMDIGVNISDCGECTVHHNQFRFMRMGLLEFGNDFSFTAHNNAYENSVPQYTSHAGLSTGFFAGGREAYVCSNTRPDCSGGTTKVIEVFPQGCSLVNETMAGWDTDVNVSNCQGLSLQANGFDFGSHGYQGNTVPNPTIVVGSTVYIANIESNYIASTNCSAKALEIQAPASPGAGTTSGTYNDLTIRGNYFLNYCTTTSGGSGVSFDPGIYARRGVRLIDNTFFNERYGVTAAHPLQYSVIRGNFGTSFPGGGAFIKLDAAGPTSFTGTVIAENTTSSSTLVIDDHAGGGYLAGYNVSPLQNLSTQIATGKGCSTGSGVGSACPVAMDIPVPYNDLNYAISGCVLVDASNQATTATVTSKKEGGFKIAEVSLSPGSAAGGTVQCTVSHN